MLKFTITPKQINGKALIECDARHDTRGKLCAHSYHLTQNTDGSWNLNEGRKTARTSKKNTWATLESATEALTARWEAYVLSTPFYARLHSEGVAA